MSDTTALALPHQSLVALTPQDMGPVQSQLAFWCKAKILELSLELRDARQNFRQAQKMKWKSAPWQRVAAKLVKRMVYYTKIKAAVQAGYLVVPNFPAEILAVRVRGDAPRFKSGAYPTQLNEAKPDLSVGPGLGRYVDERLPHIDDSYVTAENKPIRRFHVGAGAGYDEIPDFPLTVLKPVVMAATERAIGLRLFDTIGLVNQDGSTFSRARRRSDPLVVGQILDGSQMYPKDHRVTFFIAWWLDTRML